MTPDDIAKLINEDGESKPPIQLIVWVTDILSLRDLPSVFELIIKAGPDVQVDMVEVHQPTEEPIPTDMHDKDEFSKSDSDWVVVVYKAPEGTPLEDVAAELAKEMYLG